MAVITFANTKGGAGKTTAVLLLATELARKGYRVTILDADPQNWITRWYEISGKVENISVINFVTTASLPLHISENKHNTDYFIVDLPGARNPLLATAVGLSDHVLIPIQGCAMDAKGGAQVLELLGYLKEKAGVDIPHSVVLTRVNSLVTTRALQTIKAYNKAVRTDIKFNPNVKDGRRTEGLSINKSNWANTVEEPPFEAYAVTCGITFTFGGLKIDTSGRVIDTDGQAIAGLHAAGELVGGLFYFNYPGGTGLMAGSVFGKIAGTTAGQRAAQMPA